MNDAEACILIRVGDPELQKRFGVQIKELWVKRAQEKGEHTSPILKAFGSCDIKLSRFYEVGDFVLAYNKALEG